MYCVDVLSISRKVYPEIRKVLCLETAASLLGLRRSMGGTEVPKNH